MPREYQTVGVSLSPRHVRWLKRQPDGPSRTIQRLIERRMSARTPQQLPADLVGDLAEALLADREDARGRLP